MGGHRQANRKGGTALCVVQVQVQVQVQGVGGCSFFSELRNVAKKEKHGSGRRYRVQRCATSCCLNSLFFFCSRQSEERCNVQMWVKVDPARLTLNHVRLPFPP